MLGDQQVIELALSYSDLLATLALAGNVDDWRSPEAWRANSTT